MGTALMRKHRRAMSKFMDEPERAPGIGRIAFLVLVTLLVVAWMQFGSLLWERVSGYLGESMSARMEPHLHWLGIGLSLGITLLRLRNLGMSPWFLPCTVVPGVNLWLGYRCIACPPLYAYRRSIGVPGILAAIVYWLVLLTAAALLISQYPVLQESYQELEGNWRQRLRQMLELLTSHEQQAEQLDDAP